MIITKELIQQEFKKAGLPIDKIRKSKLGGFYVYHPNGMEYVQTRYSYKIIHDNPERKIVERIRIPIAIYVSFIDNEDLLKLAIFEAKNRRQEDEA